MNIEIKKNDLLLVIFLVISSLLCFTCLKYYKNSNELKASIYVENKLVYEVVLKDIDKSYEKEFKVKTGVIVINFSSKGLKVVEDSCSNHICSHQGLITNSFESIVCVPNQFYAKLSIVDSNEVVVG